MRDYKNVNVPRKLRTNYTRVDRTTVKRTSTRRVARTQVPKAGRGVLQFLLVAMIAGTGYLGWNAYQWSERTGVFLVAGVDVRGVNHLNENEVKAMAGVFTGQNIFKADIQGAARRARANPWVKEVQIERRLPNRISMTIEERVPEIIVETANGRFLADGSGTIIERLNGDASAWPLPVAVVRHLRPRPGEDAGSEELAEAYALTVELKRRGGWRPQDITIKADSVSSMAIVTAGREVRIGAGPYGEKLRRLGEVLTDVKQRNITFAYVDLRSERQAAVMAVKSQGQGARVKGKGRK